MRVALFVTCLVDLMRPSVGFAALRLLEAAGCDVAVPDTQTCCGQPVWNSGDGKAAARLARKLIAEFDRPDYEYIVAPSASCVDQIKNQYLQILADDTVWLPRAKRLSDKVYELTDFLVNVRKIENVPGRYSVASGDKQPSAVTVTYHDSCTGLRALNIKSQPRALLAQIPGVELREMGNAEECCGFGGTFSVKFGAISAAIADKKCTGAQSTGADIITGGDLGCLLNIEGRLRRKGDEKTQVRHIAEVLAGEMVLQKGEEG